MDNFVISAKTKKELEERTIKFLKVSKKYNRLINFHPSFQENLASSHVAANTPFASLSFLDTPLQLLDSIVSIPAFETSVSNSE